MRIVTKGWVVGLGAIAAIAGGVAIGLVRASSNAADLQTGRTLYLANCASCHGADLEGQPNWQTRLPDGRLPAPPHDETGHTWHHPDQDLFTIVKFGMAGLVEGYDGGMPAFAGILSDREIELALAFLKSRWPERERQYQAGRTREAAAGP